MLFVYLQARVGCVAVAPGRGFITDVPLFAIAVESPSSSSTAPPTHHKHDDSSDVDGKHGSSDGKWSVLEFIAPSPVPIHVHTLQDGQPSSIGYVPSRSVTNSGSGSGDSDASATLVCLTGNHRMIVLSGGESDDVHTPGLVHTHAMPQPQLAVTSYSAMMGTTQPDVTSSVKKRGRSESSLPDTTTLTLTGTSGGHDIDTSGLSLSKRTLTDVTSLMTMVMPALLQPAPTLVHATGSDHNNNNNKPTLLTTGSSDAMPTTVTPTATQDSVLDDDWSGVMNTEPLVAQFKEFFTAQYFQAAK